MSGGSYVLCNVIMLVMYENNRDIKWVSLYPLVSVIGALFVCLTVLPTVFITVEKPSLVKV
jgi:hypothetical protein